MSSLTRYAVLGLVARRPTYGYAVLRQLQQWSVTGDVQRSSIYDALSRLRNDGLIQLRDSSRDAGPSSERQQRTMYVATAEGDELLESWFSAAPTSFDELRLRIVLARAHDLDHLMRFVTAAEEECLARLEELDGVDIQRLMDQPSGRSAPAEALYEALLGSMTSIELDGRLRSLQTARVTLETLRNHPQYRAPTP
jgi:DNA-binding PadR family transcriptional regulator